LFRHADPVLDCSLRICALCCAAVLVAIVACLLWWSLPAFGAAGADLLGGADWRPSAGSFGLLPMLVGSAAVTLGALILAAPIGVSAAMATRSLLPRWAAIVVRRSFELLAGVPSVVLGFWGLVVIVPIVAQLRAPGASLAAGAVVLAVMILPTIGLTADAALARVPAEHRQAAAACGCSRMGILLHVSLPQAWPGIATGVVLATGRAIGETMVVLMVCGNIAQLPTSVFDPVRTLTATIGLEMAYAMDVHRAALFACGAAAMLVVGSLLLLRYLLIRESRHA